MLAINYSICDYNFYLEKKIKEININYHNSEKIIDFLRKKKLIILLFHQI
jgi:hypothetical protein